MKITFATITLTLAQEADETQVLLSPRQLSLGPGLGGRRYDQFESMAKLFDPDFDKKSITDYGCNCPELGDRPLSDPGKGQPVDELDTVCQKFKQCAKCAKEEFGESCISEMIRYGLRGKTCTDSAGTCARALCECDLSFAEALSFVDKESNQDQYGFVSDFNSDEQCIRQASGGGEKACCWNGESAFKLYNSDSKQCCPNGVPKPFGRPCDDTDSGNGGTMPY
ncbi:unnamed protein product [Oikopleura dioica]|uniref:Phospholipase A2-like central domain-containing protein n=1 Tax=Oikopleura dioica TaxID=34765 RepID=E4XBS7_OIKDI|nr:unnamed protein product [Oikopleura dioica]